MNRSQQKDEVFLHMAKILGELSTCPRGAVGAIITRDGRAVSWGFNGAPPGLPHCEENMHGHYDEWWAWAQGQDRYNDSPEGKKSWLGDRPCNNATHAEANALAFAARQGISTEGCTLYVETTPCLQCARLLIAAGINRVVFDNYYRDDSGKKLLEAAGVKVEVG